MSEVKYYSELAGKKLVTIIKSNAKPLCRARHGRDYISPTQTTYKSFLGGK
jgi:hypothetical protein